MKKSLLMVVAIVFISAELYAFAPPKGLKWGMSYDEVKTYLEKTLDKDSRVKINKMENSKSLKGFKSAKIDDIKVNDRKAHYAAAYFDLDGKLCDVVYIFQWINNENKNEQALADYASEGRSKCWAFQQQLVESITAKYNQSKSDESADKRGQEITSGTRLITTWVDSTTNDGIFITITHMTQKDLVFGQMDSYSVILEYENEIMAKANRAAQAGSNGL